jgi:hypothetical protein
MALNEFEWGGPDIGGPTADLDAAMERRQRAAPEDRDGHPPPRLRNMTGYQAMIECQRLGLGGIGHEPGWPE